MAKKKSERPKLTEMADHKVVYLSEMRKKKLDDAFNRLLDHAKKLKW